MQFDGKRALVTGAGKGKRILNFIDDVINRKKYVKSQTMLYLYTGFS